MNFIRKILVFGLACLIALSSVQMSTPLLQFMIFHDSFVYKCRIVQHHTQDCKGYCVLKHELAKQDQRKTESPNPDLQKHLKILDLNLVSSLKFPINFHIPVRIISPYSLSLINCLSETEVPPPRFSA